MKQQTAGGCCWYAKIYGYHRQKSLRDEIIQIESNGVVKIRQKSSINYSNSNVEKTLDKLHLEYCIPFQLDLFSESTRTGTGAVKTYPGTLQGIDSLFSKTLEELQHSKG